jgi:hypothetical protein
VHEISAESRGGLPEDLLREASRRLAIISLVAGSLWFLADALGHLALHAIHPADPRWLIMELEDWITVISILGKLADAGVLLVKAERQTRAEADEVLQAHRDSVWSEISSLLDGLAGPDPVRPAPASGPPAAQKAPADDDEIDWSAFEPT